MNIFKTPEGYLYSNRALLALFIPLLIEYGLEFFVGLADSIMVASLGEAAISGVSLVDFLVQLLIFSFSALATGGAVVAGQYLGDKQIDKVDGNQVAVTNIILQNVDSSIYEGTQYLNIPLVGSGTGKYISNGKIIDITWSKESDTGVTHYYDTDGNEIVLNQGQTWISLIQNPYADQNVYSAEVPQ